MAFKKYDFSRRGYFRCFVLCVVLLLAGIALWQHTFGAEFRLKQLRDEKLLQLHSAEGKISDNTIVLQDLPRSKAEALAQQLGAGIRTTPQGDFSVLYLPEGVTIADIYSDDSCLEYLDSMSLDYHASAAAVSASGQELLSGRPVYPVTDPLYDFQSYLDHLNLDNTWDTTRGSGVTVAIIDTGIDTDHPEFAGRISEASYNASEDKTVRDYGLEVIEDEQGHGTAVAGVLGAAMNNGEGITGIAPEAELIIIKCDCDSSGEFLRSSDLVFALAYAIECNADVVNMSFATELNVFADYTQLAVDSDIICVASAGNVGSSIHHYPAADPNVIGVGAFELETWELASYSNYGDNSDFLAPGTVYTTDLNGGYNVATGTSVSAPIVSGAVALYLSENAHLEYGDICAVLQASSVDLGTLGDDWVYSFGALDIHALVCEPKGTITYDMLTAEVPNQTQIFVPGHTVQIMPEPERENVVFDGWYYDAQCTDECEYYTETFSQDITLYASWINEDDGTAFIYSVLEDGTAEIQSYTGKRRYLTIPNQIEGYTVTGIGDQAFSDNSRLRSVVLPSTLTNIGIRAFYGCTNLRSIDIPEQVRAIGEEAFARCVRLQAIGIVPNGELQSFGKRAFAECAVTSITVPINLSSWGEAVLMGSSGVKSVTVTAGNAFYKIQDQALCDISGETLIYYPAALTGVYPIPAGTKTIGSYAFYGSRISEAVFPGELASIGKSAFQFSLVETVSIPASVVSLDECIWGNCGKLSQVDLSAAKGISELPENCFSYCTALEDIVLPDWFQTIGSSAFAGSGLRAITFGEESLLTTIGIYAFSSTPLESFTVPDGVTVIPLRAFADCAALAEVRFSGESSLTSIAYCAFTRCISLKEISFPDTLKTIGEQAFYATGLEEVSLGANITYLGSGAFAYCQGLNDISVSPENTAYTSCDGVLHTADQTVLVTYPAGRSGEYKLADTVTQIDAYGFAGANGLESVTMNEGLTEIDSYAFMDCSRLQTPILPQSLITIGHNAFYRCSEMSGTIDIPASVISIGRQAFYQDYNLTGVRFAENCALSRLGYATFACCGITEFEIPQSVTSMAQEVFTGCKDLIRVTFQAGSQLKNLAAWTFRGAESLQQIVFEEGCALTNLEARALEHLDALTSINLDACQDLQTIGNYAFQGCTSLSSVTLPDSLTEIGRYAFSGCSRLTTIHIPEATDFIGRYAFSGTGGIKVYFTSSVLPLNLQEYWDFDIAHYYLGASEILTSDVWEYTLTSSGDASLVSYNGTAEELTIDMIDGHPVTAIGSGAFMDNTTLRNVVLPDTLLGIYKKAFAGTANLETVTIPASVTVIDEYAFQGSGITQAVFEDGSQLAILGRYAFADTSNLTSFTLPEGIQKIRDRAFENSGIQTFCFPDQTVLTEIGSNAFAGSRLTGITLPDTLTRIGYNAFSGCSALSSVAFGTGADLMIYGNAFYQTGLTSVEIPANVTYLGEFCFADCPNLEQISVSADNTWYASAEGVLYSADYSRLISCPAGKTGTLTIPDEVTALAFGALEGSRLSSVTISDSSRLSTLGYRAFFRCSSLEEITIPDGLLSIDRYAFAYCTNLKTVHIGEGSQLGGIYNSAFYQCTSLGSIDIPAGVQEIDDNAFYGCENLTQLNLAAESQLKTIGGSAFRNCAVQELIMPEHLYEIGSYAFQNTGMATLVPNEEILRIGDYAFAGCPLANTTVLVFPENMEYLGKFSLNGVTALEELTIPFLGTERNIPYRLVDLLSDAFLSNPITDTLHTLHVLHGDIGDYALYQLDQLKTVTVGPDCIRIGVFGLKETGITEFHITENIAEFGSEPFAGCVNLTKLTVAEENPWFEAVDSVLYDEEMTTLLFAPMGISGTLTIPETVRVIDHAACLGCSKLTEVVFPRNLQEIGTSAFKECSSLTDIVLPDSITELGSSAFSDCTSVKRFVFSAQLDSIPAGIFYRSGQKGCVVEFRNSPVTIERMAFAESKLQSVTLPDSVETIEEYAFAGCSDLAHIDLGSSLTAIGRHAFSASYSTRCGSLETITLPDTLKTIGEYAFSESALKTITLPRGLTLLEEGALTGCDNLESIMVEDGNANYCTVDGCLYTADRTALLLVPPMISGEVVIPDGVTSLGVGAFANCVNLKQIVIPQSVTQIGVECFLNCASLESVTMDFQLDTLPRSMFSDCTSLKEITIPDGVLVIDDSCFFGCTALEKVHLPEGLQTLGDGCFWNCSALPAVDLPSSLELVDYWVFCGCDRLAEITGGSGIKYFKTNGFSDTLYYQTESNWDNGILYLGDICIDIKRTGTVIRLREGIRVIAENACTSDMTEILILPDTVEYVGGSAFSWSENLKYVRMSSAMKELGHNIFFKCPGLKTLHIPANTEHVNYLLYQSTGDAFPELHSILVESSACMEQLYVRGSAIKTLIIPYSEKTTASKVISNFQSSPTNVENLVITGNHLTQDFLYDISSDTVIYCEVPEGYFTYNSSNPIYYQDEWHLATFWSDGILVQATPHTLGAVVEVPSESVMAELALGSDSFAGWDINGDGEADQIPATLSGDLEAHALWVHEHVPVMVPGREPTCTDDGCSEGSYCSECGEILVESVILPATGHNYEVAVTEPTCTEQGFTVHTCTACGDSYTDSYVVAPGHSYETAVTEPTCTEQGFTVHTCTACGDSYTDGYTEALGHDIGDWQTVTEVTCTVDGSEKRECSRCDHSETRVIEAPGHDWDEGIVTIEPTEETAGEMTYTCRTCYETRTEAIPELGHTHSYDSVVVAPTCTEQGHTSHTCRCGDSYKDSYTDALGHDFTEWTVVTAPTVTAEGLESRYCLRCGTEETRTLACLENPFTDVPEGSFYYDPVMWAVEKGITNGTTPTTFSPNDQCMRANVVTFLWRAVGCPEPTRTDNPFTDVKPTDFYYKAVLWAVEKGITNGLDATHFGPFAYCNRAQVVTFLYRTLGCPEIASAENPFTDVDSGSFYEKPVLWAVENGITNGLSPTSFGPGSICNRAQIVTFLHRAFVTE